MTTPLHAVAVLLLDGEGHTWLARRRRAPLEGLWECPGGAVEAGETHWQAAVREVREETGLTVPEEALRRVAATCVYVGGREVRCHLFVWRVPEGVEPHDAEPDARCRWWWLRPSDMQAHMCTPATGALLALAPWAQREGT